MEPGQEPGWPSEAQLLAELPVAFPGIFARPLREFSKNEPQYGVWTGGEATTKNGHPLFCSYECPDQRIYNGRVHVRLERFLEERGWYIEDYDGATFFILPIAMLEAL